MIHQDLLKLRREWQLQLPAQSPDLGSVRPTLLPKTSVFGRISCWQALNRAKGKILDFAWFGSPVGQSFYPAYSDCMRSSPVLM